MFKITFESIRERDREREDSNGHQNHFTIINSSGLLNLLAQHRQHVRSLSRNYYLLQTLRKY